MLLSLVVGSFLRSMRHEVNAYTLEVILSLVFFASGIVSVVMVMILIWTRL